MLINDFCVSLTFLSATKNKIKHSKYVEQYVLIFFNFV